ncbi:phosphomethylpyrimidine kinase [Cellulomonas cellasea DSM 20118]|uniref:Phosphomethylpyrimidine kinase n=2 Tax=Cellulomonas cellasea TaxID=43670 RepID=A0A0A0B8M9_9CELL|nr:bifunctional hydroxymethylpyrimidine kinase/phosphomethylpyrimidine kinase [Cellulomonas cellasea]KGM01596.1 phosphomethylpyrimidine kinase [Cellulomonas cellasea DSM 20118]GEA88210.1 hypothetical protein CCE01nite_21590 [Cellulomonas cellasea]
MGPRPVARRERVVSAPLGGAPSPADGPGGPDAAPDRVLFGAPGGPSRPRVLSVAGTDPTGGAGIQADLKSIAAHGGYGMAVVTALVAQNTRGVRASHVPNPAFLRAQLDAVSDDVTVDALKIGMVATEAVARELGAWLAVHRPPHVVLDPVMVATSGDRLLDGGAEDAVRSLLAHADLVTPNLPELAVLLDEPVAATWAEALDQGARLARRHGVAVLVKGGHLAGEPGRSPDAVVTVEGTVEIDAARVATLHTHGTGCSLSAAVATLRPQRDDWVPAVREAKEWLTGALRAGAALQVGTGNGPVDHAHLQGSARAFTHGAWEQVADLRAACDELVFVRGLAAGTLEPAQFAFYLAQDALYLREYSRVLARASELAPDREAQEFFARGAHHCLAVESDLHRRWLGRYGPTRAGDAGTGGAGTGAAATSPVTAAYTDHLRAVAASGSYAELVAAVLPCYWLYADIGARLLARADLDGHPYADWIATYGDPEFARASDRARALTDAAARSVGPAERARMLEAFVRSCRHEWLFFAQGTSMPSWPAPSPAAAEPEPAGVR